MHSSYLGAVSRLFGWYEESVLAAAISTAVSVSGTMNSSSSFVGASRSSCVSAVSVWPCAAFIWSRSAKGLAYSAPQVSHQYLLAICWLLVAVLLALFPSPGRWVAMCALTAYNEAKGRLQVAHWYGFVCVFLWEYSCTEVRKDFGQLSQRYWRSVLWMRKWCEYTWCDLKLWSTQTEIMLMNLATWFNTLTVCYRWYKHMDVCLCACEGEGSGSRRLEMFCRKPHSCKASRQCAPAHA